MSRLLGIDDLVIEYGGGPEPVRAIDGTSLTLDDNETLAIVGESGSGKTTLGMAAGRLLPPEARNARGTIRVAGTSVFAADPPTLRQLRREQLGFVFQNPMAALDPTMRIGPQVRRAMGYRAPPAEVAALLQRAELEDAERVLRSFPHELSGGMAQRVVIAMAIARGPRLLIADEPTASLDASIRDRVMRTLCRLREETGASMAILSHDLRLVARYCDRIAVMYGGRIVEAGASRSILEQPAHPYTRALINAAAGNERPGERLQPIPGTPPVLRGGCEACAYEPRCTFAESDCAHKRPETREVAGRQVVCHFAERVLRTTAATAEVTTE